MQTRTYSPAEKGKAEATNDFSIFVVGLAASLSAGALQNTVGWQSLNMMLLPWLALAAAAILWLGSIGSKAVTQPLSG